MTATAFSFQNRYLFWLSCVSAVIFQTALGSLLWQICGNGEYVSRKIVPLIALNLRNHKVTQATTANQTEKKVEPQKKLKPEPAVSTPISSPPLVRSESAPEIKKTAADKPRMAKRTPRVAAKPMQPPDKLKNASTAMFSAPKTDNVPVENRAINDEEARRHGSVSASSSVRQNLQPDVQSSGEAPKSVVSEAMQSEINRYLVSVRTQLEKAKRYPKNARRRRISGKVPVSFVIQADGRSGSVSSNGQAPAELVEAAVELVGSQKFPAPPDGWQTGSRIEITINYHLR